MQHIKNSIIISIWIHAVCYYSYFIRTIIDFGHIPSYKNPDPTNLYPIHRSIVFISANISIVAILALIVFFIFTNKNKIFTKRDTLFIVLGIFVFLFALVLDPSNEWFAD
jgi:glucan phosphoethanolaminetransferase (alkaline phosphatase superfamily)